MSEKVNVGGLSVEVVSNEEAEKADYVVCSPEGPSPFTDNLIGNCCKCGVKVMYRWHAPRTPKKICIFCVTDTVKNKP
jgi:hypothetical protein